LPHHNETTRGYDPTRLALPENDSVQYGQRVTVWGRQTLHIITADITYNVRRCYIQSLKMLHIITADITC